MPWTSPMTFVAGTPLPASDLNTHLRDNTLALRAGGISVPSQAALDFFFATTTTQMGRLAAVAGKVPRLNVAGTAWEMVYPSAGVHEMFVPASSFSPKVSGGCGGLEVLLLSAGIYVSACPFDGTSTEGAFFNLAFPKSWNKGTLTYLPWWLQIAGGSGDVVWSCKGVAVSDGDSLDVAAGTPQTSTDTAQTSEVLCVGPESAAITFAGSPVNRDLVRLEIERTPAAGGDTFNGVDAYLIGLMLRFTTDNADDA